MGSHRRADDVERSEWAIGILRNDTFVQRIFESLDTLQGGTPNGRNVVSHNNYINELSIYEAVAQWCNKFTLPAADPHVEHETTTEVLPELVSRLT